MEFLISITIKSTFILLFSGILLWALKNATATLRHWVISLTMIGLLALPVLVGIMPDILVTVPYLPIKEQSIEWIASKAIATPERITNDNLEFSKNIPFVLKEEVDNSQAIVNNDTDNQLDIRNKNSIPIKEAKTVSLERLLLFIWLIGGLFFLLKLIIGRFLIHKITINSEPFFLEGNLEDYVARITKKEVRFLVSHAIKTPMTWRGFKPVVLLPIAAKSWPVMELKTVLLHELNHIKRNDYWLHTLGLITVCLYWYHPLIWIMKKRQLLEREKACDEAVLRAGIPQQNYAEQLVNIARQLSGRPAIISEAALPMAKVSQTKARILAILKFDQQKFNFSKWKQWNWGLFYAFLFPVLAAFSPVGTIIQAHFDLPKLDSVSTALVIPQNESISIPTDLFSKIKKQLLPIAETAIDKENIKGTPLINDKIAALETLERSESFLPIPSQETSIKVSQKPQKTGLFGKWKEGKSEFKIWTYGDFKLIPEAPFIEVTTPDGIVFIEEYIPGLFSDKVNQLTIAKAATNVRKRGTYKKAMDMRPSALITKGTPIKIWSENSNYDKWMATKGQQIAQQLMKKKETYLVKEVADENSVWWSRVEGARGWIDFYFVTESKIAAKIERRRKRSMLKSDAIPYQKLPYLNEKGQTQIIGPTTLSGKDVGNKLLRKSLNPKGTEYMTVLTGTDKPALVKEFNFHLSKNDFKDLVFELQLYNIVDGEIKYAITQSPIPIMVKRGSGWIKKDLSSYGIVSQGDILVILENIDFSGAKNGKGLYFSLADNYEAYQYLISANFEWKTKRILERAFVMNLEVEQSMDGVGVIEKEVIKTTIAQKPTNLSAKKIIKTAISRLKENYLQKSYNADLFYRYSRLTPSDSLIYQSEAVLKYYDSKGYQKRGWRNAATSRYAKLEEGRITVGEQKEKMKLSELGKFFVFWSHEPIITNDKPLSENSMGAYEYTLVGKKEFMGQQVFEIEFVCTKLKDRFAGLPSLKYMKGKLYINQADYAIIRYEQSYLMDYEFTGKHPKKRGHLKERNIIESSRIEIFSKNEDGYYLDYSKMIDRNEKQHTLLDGKKEIHKGKFVEEYQYSNIDTKNVEPLTENLFKFNKETTYNSNFWEPFTIDWNQERVVK